MQYIESSIVGMRSAVITFKHQTAQLRFVLFPMVHVAEPAFYTEVAARARLCQLIVAESAPSRYAPAQFWMARIRFDRLVDQIVALDLEALGVPIRWEMPPPEEDTQAQQIRNKVVDGASAIGLRLLGRYGNPLGGSSLEQADDHDDRWADPGSRIGRFLTGNILHQRDRQLVQMLNELHQGRPAGPATIAVIYGAAHIPAAVDFLTETLGYHVDHAEWLVVANAPS
jgi:hypothetical protein